MNSLEGGLERSREGYVLRNKTHQQSDEMMGSEWSTYLAAML